MTNTEALLLSLLLSLSRMQRRPSLVSPSLALSYATKASAAAISSLTPPPVLRECPEECREAVSSLMLQLQDPLIYHNYVTFEILLS